MNPTVSVLVPVYNGMPYLPDALKSVLRQTWSDFEVVVVDDASTDDSWTAIQAITDRDSRVRAVRNETNLGLPGALNRGMELSRGKWIARQDQDDLCDPRRLERQLAFLRAHADVKLLFSDARIVDAEGRPRGRRRTVTRPEEARWDLCFRCNFPHSSAIFARATALSLGGYRNVHACEDWDLWSRFAEVAEVASLRAPLMKYRVHERSMMGVENKARLAKSAPFLREIMRRNFERFACIDPDGPAARIMIDAWVDLPGSGWDAYFAAREETARDYGAAGSSGFRRLVGEQDFMLFCRLAGRGRREAVEFLRARWHCCPGRRFDFPWVRAAAILAMARG